MTSAQPFPVTVPSLSAVRVAEPFYHRAALIQILACSAPAMAAVFFSQPRAGAIYFLAVLFVCLLVNIVERRPLEASTIAIGTLPVWMLLRNYFYYNSIELILALCAFSWMEGQNPDFRAIWRDRVVQSLVAVFTLYWAIAWICTGLYSAEMRALELVFSAVNVALLGKHRRFLATAFLGVAASVVVMGVGLLPHGDRLGMAYIDGVRLGNPISFGVPAALTLLLSWADGGRWLLLRNRPNLRRLINVVAGAFLLLSTSRGSWLVLAVGAAIIVVTDRRQRKVVLGSLGAVIIAGAIWIQVDDSPVLSDYLNKTFSPEESWSKRTTGRAEQWEAFPRVLHDSPVWGFGPGNGRRISVLYAHKNIIWHSIYLQFGAETGLIGLSILALLLAALVRRAFRHYRLTRETMPLIGIIGFMTIAISVPAIDGLSGMFIGMALIGCDVSRFFVLRQVRTLAPVTTMPASSI